MTLVQSKLTLVLMVALVIIGTICVVERIEFNLVKQEHRILMGENRELSDNCDVLSTAVHARDAEILRLRSETSEILDLRNQLAQARAQVALAAKDQSANTAQEANDLTGYMTKEQLRFAGYGSPENALLSMEWARLNGDYTNWMAALAPQLQQEELANSHSLEMFQRDSAETFRGMQVLATKSVGTDRMEMKVRLDTANSVAILIFPMLAVGTEWRLGDEIRAYTETWDRSGGAP